MLMEMPVRPEEIIDKDKQPLLDLLIKKLNHRLKTESQYDKCGPFVCVSLDDWKPDKFFDSNLLNSVIEEVKIIFKSAGWECCDETQPSGTRYFTFVSKIWGNE